jgi:8-oxo-dGTP pyrophosphatase MutT (NUDIX family)
MKTTSNIIVIINGAVLLVLKKNTWILPGGKHEPGESDKECLLRECSEELPGSFVEIGPKLGAFEGFTPHSKEPVTSTVFFGNIRGSIVAGAEIDRAQWFVKNDLEEIQVSELTRLILNTINFCTDGLPQIMIDGLDSEEGKATWVFCGPLPLEEIAKGHRACRHGWRNRSYSSYRGVNLEPETEDGTWPMLSVSLDNNEDDPGMIVGTEYAEEFGQATYPVSIRDMLATDWYLELEK